MQPVHCSLFHQSGTTREARPKIEFPTLACFSFSFFFAGQQTNFVKMKFKTLASLMKINTDLLWGVGISPVSPEKVATLTTLIGLKLENVEDVPALPLHLPSPLLLQ